MKCGTNYTAYMTAYNHVGPGHSSNVVSAKTLGRVPDIPNTSDLMEVNKVYMLSAESDDENFNKMNTV